MTRPPKVLIVDDESDYLRIAARIAAAAGCEVLTAATAAEGVALGAKELPDLVLMDVGLPDGSGFGAARALRGYKKLSSVPVIFFTVRCELDMVREGLSLGRAGYVLKPFDPDELERRIREAVFPS